MPTIFLNARWENLIMANYAVDPAVLEPFLPKGVEIDQFEGKTYVSLVGFMFAPTHFFSLPIPFFFSFEEINLRFYVKRRVAYETRRGVVFINETVPFRSIAWIANKLYREHYTAVQTKHSFNLSEAGKKIRYAWKVNDKWDHLSVLSSNGSSEMKSESLEEFIFEHYYGYTRIDERITQEYRIHHPRWKVNQVREHAVHCDFTAMYGKSFSFLQDAAPDAVFLAEGSRVMIEWKRNQL